MLTCGCAAAAGPRYKQSPAQISISLPNQNGTRTLASNQGHDMQAKSDATGRVGLPRFTNLGQPIAFCEVHVGKSHLDGRRASAQSWRSTCCSGIRRGRRGDACPIADYPQRQRLFQQQQEPQQLLCFPSCWGAARGIMASSSRMRHDSTPTGVLIFVGSRALRDVAYQLRTTLPVACEPGYNSPAPRSWQHALSSKAKSCRTSPAAGLVGRKGLGGLEQGIKPCLHRGSFAVVHTASNAPDPI